MLDILSECNYLRNVMRFAIWYHLYNLKNMKNTHGGVLLLEPAALLEITLIHGCFSRFFKLCKCYQIALQYYSEC